MPSTNKIKMLYIKKANLEDQEEEFVYLQKTPYLETGFRNVYALRQQEDFINNDLPWLINQSNPKTAASYAKPMTTYFLWLDNTIIGMYQVIHELTEFQREHDGHIAYTLLKEYRGKGYATKGLSLVIEDAKQYILEDEIYMHTTKDNPASLHVMLNNGAYISKETEIDYFTRIKIK